MILHNVLTWHHRILARFLRKRGWVVFYLEKEARSCTEGSCWLKLYEYEMNAELRKGA